MGKILLVDDEPAVLFTLQEVLSERGHRTVSSASGAEALERLEGVDAVLTDLQMPGMDGLELLRSIRDRDSTLPVLLVTAHGNEKVAVSAMKAGAYDYLTKPFDIDEVALVVERALESRQLRIANRRLVAEQALGRRLVADSAPMRRLLDAVERLAEKDVTVLIRGETGTGKELIASLLHAHSRRAKKPFVRFNCAAIPAELAESELFGHVKGAFTGAQTSRRGFFSEAGGGTLVLDEIGELPAGVQAKLLRALQDGEIQPVGSARPEKVDVRVVASTNRDLRAEAAAGRFREDLYYRLAVVELSVPPLRERRDDIPKLAEEFARRYAEKFGLDELRLADGLLARLRESDWPGNVRQLENTVARLAALSTGGVIEADAFDPISAAPEAPSMEGAGNAVDGPSLREQVEAFERNLISRALATTGGNQSEAARRLGTSRVTLIDKIKKYGLHR
ncbi:MAG TPA: sigma-54 dependent transcriptional regulator [Polyangia bacterium]|nr:sigma-54 dependent transcriptional regulator [Polyangia bacterium]